MSWFYILGLALTLGLLAYLCAALLYPEYFT